MTDAERIELALRRTYGNGNKTWSPEMAIFIECFLTELVIVNNDARREKREASS